MKIYKTDEFIEKLNINSIKLNDFDFYNYHPKDKKELLSIIKKRIRIEGLNCNLNDIDVFNITDMSKLFCNLEFNGDISKWDVSNVEDMSYMFTDAKNFNKDISSWNVSNVKSMYGMFGNCQLEKHKEKQPKINN